MKKTRIPKKKYLTSQQNRALLVVIKKKKRSGPAAVMAKAVSVLSQLETTKPSPVPVPVISQPEKKEDEDLVYAKYIAQEINKVRDLHIKTNLKLKIQSAICDAQLEQASSNTENQGEIWRPQIQYSQTLNAPRPVALY